MVKNEMIKNNRNIPDFRKNVNFSNSKKSLNTQPLNNNINAQNFKLKKKKQQLSILTQLKNLKKKELLQQGKLNKVQNKNKIKSISNNILELNKLKKREPIGINEQTIKYYSMYINMLLKRGNKSTIETRFFDMLRVLTKEKLKVNKSKKDSFKIKKKRKYFMLVSKFFWIVLNRGRPLVDFISKRRGARVYQIPIDISIKREFFQGIHWTITESCGRKKGNFDKMLLKELIALSISQGAVIRLKKAVYALAKQNRIYISKFFLA